MTQKEPSREALEHQALEAQNAQSEKQEYVERPKSQRILAWVLAGVVVVGVVLYAAWLAGFLK